MKRFEIFFGIIKVPLDFLMTVLGFLIAYKLRLITDSYGIAKEIDLTALPTVSEYFNQSLFAASVLVIIFALGRLYTLKSTNKFGNESRKTITLWVIWVMALITYQFLNQSLPFSRLAIFYTWTITLALILLARGLVRIIQTALLKNGLGKRHLLLIGKNNISKEIEKQLSNDPSYKIVGTMDSISKLEYTIKHKKVDEVIQTGGKNEEEIIEICETNHVNYRFIPDLLDVRRSNIEIHTLGSMPIISLKKTPLDGWGKVVKRAIDFFAALLGIIILSPLLIITSVAIKIDSKGPILFSKLDNGKPVKRIGQRGKPFRFYKFRSMKPNTDSHRYSHLSKHNTRTEGPLVKIKNDPRVTAVGRFIRKYSIDELPQLLSVLAGDMSLTGPRPHLPEEVAKYQKHHHFVLTIKPGISGLAQISGRSDLSFEEEVKLDRFYIENWSIWLDLKILIRTIKIVLKGHEE